MTILTREQIVALMALVGEATDGPWQVLHIVDTHPEFDTPDLVEVVTSDDSPSVATICRVSTDGDDEVSAVLADAAFIAATRTGVPDLIATARAYHDLRDAVLALCDGSPDNGIGIAALHEADVREVVARVERGE